MNTLKETIIAKLTEIEQKENVKILYAVESGSRAWGFASPDSDYDVRFIYLRPREFYLKLEATRDVIEWQLDEILDINGWDLQKALRLLHSSNPTLFEWASSPLIYKTTVVWNDISKEFTDFFQAKRGIYHYLNTANNNYDRHFNQDTVKLKKYFYVLRPLLACKWILDKNCPPPMLFSELVATELEADISPVVEELLALKTVTSETGEGERIAVLDDYIEHLIGEIKTRGAALPDADKADWQFLDDLFRRTLEVVYR